MSDRYRRTVEQVIEDMRAGTGLWSNDGDLVEAEILALRAERDTWREGARGVTAELAAVADALGAQTDVLECARNIHAERDALRAAVLDMPNPVSVAQKFWEKRHASVIARAREAGE